MNTKVKYKDITFGLEKHPNTNQPLTVSDNNAIRSSLKNLVMMNHYDKPFHPEIGSGVYDLLFEPMNDATTIMLRENIAEVLGSYEPRINLSGVSVEPFYEQGLYQITIVYSFINQTETQELGLTMEVLR
tara:strand:+ start:1869 stop:2258 length:390 start_codon:yes stop_codon:yes gene_type:complete